MELVTKLPYDEEEKGNRISQVNERILGIPQDIVQQKSEEMYITAGRCTMTQQHLRYGHKYRLSIL